MAPISIKRPSIICSFLACLVMASPAYALFAKLSTNLVAVVTISGVKPSGNANINQSKYPASPGILSMKVSKVNLPDGSILAVNLSDCPWFGPVAYLKVFSGSASLSTSLPAICQIGRTSSIAVSYQTSVVMVGGSPWTI
jgi:hypothetical protein